MLNDQPQSSQPSSLAATATSDPQLGMASVVRSTLPRVEQAAPDGLRAALDAMPTEAVRVAGLFARDQQGRTLFHDAAETGASTLRMALSQVQHPGERWRALTAGDTRGRTAMHEAADGDAATLETALAGFQGNKDRMRALSRRDLSGRTPLHEAADRGDATFSVALEPFVSSEPLESSLSTLRVLTLGDGYGRTPLHVLAGGEDVRAFLRALDRLGSNAGRAAALLTGDHEQVTPLHVAASNYYARAEGPVSGYSWLLPSGAHRNSPSQEHGREDMTMLNVALASFEGAAARAAVSTVDGSGRTPLHEAAGGCVSTIEAALAVFPDGEARAQALMRRDIKGQTAVGVAASRGPDELRAALAALPSDRRESAMLARDLSGECPYDYTQRRDLTRGAYDPSQILAELRYRDDDAPHAISPTPAHASQPVAASANVRVGSSVGPSGSPQARSPERGSRSR